jgi:hypothetical protein
MRAEVKHESPRQAIGVKPYYKVGNTLNKVAVFSQMLQFFLYPAAFSDFGWLSRIHRVAWWTRDAASHSPNFRLMFSRWV